MLSDFPCMTKGIDKKKAPYELNISKMKHNRKLKNRPIYFSQIHFNKDCRRIKTLYFQYIVLKNVYLHSTEWNFIKDLDEDFKHLDGSMGETMKPKAQE